MIGGPDGHLPARFAKHPPAYRNDDSCFLCHRDEIGRHYQTTVGVSPPQKGFESLDAISPQGHNGLIVQLEFVSFDASSEVSFELKTGDGALPHLAVEQFATCPAQRLRTIHGRICVSQNGLRRLVTALPSWRCRCSPT